ncbi:hypothetical protein [Streptomyces sp. NPDC047000]|uniref:hypothetical protein n=1 Tax=Streptomyces sp. NPDC047000 TaxID=3155474 RepID=UPI0033D616CC
MKSLAITLTVHRPDPVTGVRKPARERFHEVAGSAPPTGDVTDPPPDRSPVLPASPITQESTRV